MAEHVLGDAWGPARRGVSPREVDRVIREVAAECNVPVSSIRSRKRGSGGVVYEARKEVWRRLAKPNISIVSIAREWPVHHTAVLQGLGRIKQQDRRPNA